jgi:FAD/FMN-containing dehydrogenase
MSDGFDWAGFAASLGGIAVESNPALVKQKSRDFYWYSPVLKKQLRDVTADLVVMPRSEAEVIEVLRRCHAARVPVTPRGGGTGNYGQAMPLRGGVVLDLLGLDMMHPVRDGILRVGAGVKLGEIEARCRKQGWELRMFPSTRRTATIGGFIGGGSGGVGSINFGQMREPGTLLAARVVTMEEAPQAMELRGAEVNRVHHAYGTNGIITELEIAMAPAQPWRDYVVGFAEFLPLARFADAVARADGIAKRLVTAVDAEAAAYFRPLRDVLVPGEAVGLFLIAAQSAEPFEELLRAHGGAVRRRLTEAELEAQAAVPAFEFTWNHTTLQALKLDRSITYLQARFPARGYLDAVAEVMANYGSEVPMHLEFLRVGGEVACGGLPLIRYTNEPRLRAIIADFEARGITIFDPHTYVLEDGGMKQTDPEQLAFKRRADPLGLLNPGKMRGWEELAAGGAPLTPALSRREREQ